jgi:V8-like Glu-specific endopeptidase
MSQQNPPIKAPPNSSIFISLTMKIIIILATLLSLATADLGVNSRFLEVPENPDDWVYQGKDIGSGRDGRISSGQSASDTQFPWAAQMGINLQSGGLRCTGSLIKANWIVSARHCIAE